MQKDLQSYVRVYNNIMSKELCEETIEQLKTAQFQTHEFYNAALNTTESYDHELAVSWSNVPNRDKLTKDMWNVVNQYIRTDFNFPWHDSWQGYLGIRFNKYDTDTQMKEHCDHITDMFDGTRRGIPVLSIVGILNDDYEGGDFIMWEDTKIELKQGDVLVFPSVFLYPHRVERITKGTRYSFVSWTW
jgi:2OG-Fe(II) oxygenase superfamily